MDPQQSQPTRQMPKSTAWVVIIVIVVILAVGGYFLLKQGSTNTNNANTTVNSTNSNRNTNGVTSTNQITITNADLAGWKIYHNLNPKLQFDFPSDLIQQQNYPNRLVQSAQKTGAIEFIQLGIITEEEIIANKSAEKYVDGISMEFSGTFKELSKANQVKYGSNQLIAKSYIYHATLQEAGDYTKKLLYS